MSRQFIASSYLTIPVHRHRHNTFALFFALILSGCTIEGPERLVYLKSGEVVVLRGDTLSSVAARHGVSVKDLAECNGLKAPYRLTNITKLQLPGGRAHFSTEPEPVSSGPVILKDNEDVQWTDVGGGPEERSSKSQKPVLMADIDADSDLENSLTETDERSDDDSDSKPSQSRDGWNVTNHSKKGAERSDNQPKTVGKTEEKVKKSVKKGPPKSTGFCRPVSGKITEKFKKSKKGPQNVGIKFKAPKNTPVYASSDGKVVHSGKLSGDPSKVVILIDHPNNWSTCYKSIDRACVSAEQGVKQGQLIGYSSGPDCIFELRNARGPVDPEKKFNA
ncbi:MAG: M23 family metallopeptidase [Alphaproteobacteria bacterium]|nr:M23 family metallopeptidase [Alphaproteobacteria bacterium]